VVKGDDLSSCFHDVAVARFVSPQGGWSLAAGRPDTPPSANDSHQVSPDKASQEAQKFL
jgi:hypothetical protein